MFKEAQMTAEVELETTGYRIINGSDKAAVETAVQEALSTGWLLHGSLQIHVNTNVWYFAQVVTKLTAKDTRGAWG